MKTQLEKAQTGLNLAADVKPIGQPDWPTKSSEYVPPLEMYWKELVHWMSTVKPQAGVAGGSLLFGLINVINGPHSFRVVVIAGVSMIAAGSAKYEVSLVWPDLNMIQQLVVAVEVGLVVAYILHKSFDGIRIILGLALGLGCSVLLEPFMHTEFWPLNASVIWYSFFAIAGVVLGYTSYNRHVLALLTPCLGGFLCATALGFFAKTFMESNFHPANGPAKPEPHWAEIRGDSWLDFASELLTGAPSAGIFKPYQASETYSINFDRMAGFFVWFILFLIGAKRQWRLAVQKADEEILSLKQSLLGVTPATKDDKFWGA